MAWRNLLMRTRRNVRSKKICLSDFNVIAIATMVVSILLILSMIIYVIITNNQNVYAVSNVSQMQEVQMEEYSEIDIYQYIVTNVEAVVTEEIIIETIDLEYTTTYEEDASLAKGVMQVVREGRDGVQEVTTKRKYVEDVLISEETISNKITRQPINKIVKLGTSSYTNKYKAKIGDKLYVFSDMLTMREEPDEDSEKITALRQNSAVEILEIEDEWYKVKSSYLTGWVDSAGLTDIDPTEAYSGQLSKSKLLSTLSFNMKLNQKSGLSLSQFKKVLNDSKDTKGVFAQNAEYFYYIEREYGINGIFVAALGIHESAWGTSKIAVNKKNLFGYGASDSDPYNNAYNFSNYAEGIDLVARVLVKYYINEPGTSIYEGTASGKYYSSPTLSGVGKRYASDSNWASAVYKWMSYLYNKI